MKEFIITVQKLRKAQSDYAATPSDKNYFRMLDLDAIVDFMAGYLLKEEEATQKKFPYPIILN